MMTTPNGSSYKTWLTDVEPGSGTLAQALKVYRTWLLAGKKPQTVDQIRQAMISTLTPEWSVVSRTIADRLIVTYGLVPWSTSYLPSAPQQLLDLLGSRAMCREFLDRQVMLAGGFPHTYGDTGAFVTTQPSTWRPGMGLFNASRSHASGIVDIYWDASGNPTMLKLVEANYGTGGSAYQRPGSSGQLPWARTISVGRTIAVSEVLGGYAVVNFDR